MLAHEFSISLSFDETFFCVLECNPHDTVWLYLGSNTHKLLYLQRGKGGVSQAQLLRRESMGKRYPDSGHLR